MVETERKTIFLVDDNITNLTIGKNALAEFYNVFTLNSGARLMKMLEKSIPDLILLDVEMPDMNGYETIELVKNSIAARHVPVIFLTAKSDSDSELEGLSLGAIDYIVKPFSPPLLRKRIEVHLLVEDQKRQLMEYNLNLKQMVEDKTATVVELKNAILKTMAELVECRDDITGGHVERTQGYLRIMLEALLGNPLYVDEITGWNTGLILQSAQLHDVGKIAIQDSILKKPGPLSREEFEKIKEHTSFGEQVIEKIKHSTTEQDFLDQAGIMVATHHEKWDGTGYPRGLSGRDIPLQGRLMAIVDVYDALVSNRPYKRALGHDIAVSIIHDAKGTHFDPDLVDMFMDVAGEFDKVAKGHKSDPGPIYCL